MAELISSAANPLVKRVRALADRRHRRRDGAFFVEGIQPVWQAVTAGAEIETLIVAPDLLAGSPAAGMVAEQEARGTRVARLDRELFGRLSDRDGPSGLAAIVHGRLAALVDLPLRPDSVLVVLHRIGNPGNLGTIIRTADATGSAGVVLLGDTADPFAPAAVKASMGAIFAVPVARVRDPGELLAWTAARGLCVVTTSAHADAEHWTISYRPPLALLLGSEGAGLPPELLARGDLQVRIPMVGTAHSLNLAVAAGVLLYEVRRAALRPGA
ncbi:MAG TPA: RNA methyltransferase [Actinomycetes bacterium]|nr:RNA methyltransferase [Actinomycetes bacterium]